MTVNNKTPVAAGACHCVTAFSICDCNNSTNILPVQLPRLKPIVRKHIEKFIAEVGAAPFYSRRFNDSLPELLAKVLRIEREERP